MLIGVFVTALIARYFGPEQYGQFNYTLAFVTLFTAISTLGLETLTIKSIVEKKYNEGVILGSSLFLRVCGGVILTIIASLLIKVFENDSDIHILVLVMSFTMIIKAFEVIEYWIQANQLSRISSLIRIISTIIISLLKIALVYSGGNIIHLAIIYLIDATIIGISLIIAYFIIREQKSSLRVSLEYSKDILSQSWYLILSGLMVSIYMRIDQVMLGTMLPSTIEVGIYSAAARIAEMWYFVPLAIITSFKAVIMNNKMKNESQYLDSVQKLYTIIAWIGIGASVAFLFLSEPIVYLLYGTDYKEASSILKISIWAGIFAILGSARAVWLITEGLQKYTLIFMFSGAFVNVTLNLILIPYFHGQGAAMATLISQFIAVFLFPLFFKKTRFSSIMIIKAFKITSVLRK